jgi:hypothetical protein
LPSQPHWLVLAAAIVGAVSGVVSLLLLIFSTGRRIGQVETKIEAIESKAIGQKDWGELGNKVETLYRIYVLEALSRDRNADDAPKRKGR